MNSHSLRISGFTLIELLIYSGLVTMILSAFLATSNYLIISSQRDRERHALVENENFLTRKIEWMIYGATTAQITPSSGSATTLQVQRSCSDLAKLTLANGALQYTKNSNADCVLDASDPAFNLSNSHVQISNFQVDRITANSQQALQVQFTLTGQYNTRSFNKTVYIQ
jgi:Tfp pilus assembly protein PilE